MAGNAPAPWHASSLAYVQNEPNVNVTYTVKMWAGNLATGERVAIPATRVQVSLDATRTPMGVATFQTPVPPWAGVVWPVVPGYALTWQQAPFACTPVEILAGWKHDIGGVLTDDQQRIMFGYVTACKRRRAGDGSAYLEWTVNTADKQWEYPSHRTYNVADTLTKVSQVAAAWQAASDRWYIDPQVVDGTLNAPTASQLASFRAADIGIGDTVGDFFRLAALTLGQVCRPDWRADVLRWRVDADTAPSTAAALVLPSAISTEEVASQDGGWGSVLNLKCQWWASDTAKTTQRTFPSSGLGGITPTRGTAAAVARDALVYLQPPGGVIPTDTAWGPTAAWLRRVQTRNALALTVTSRAAWWIQPGDVVTYTAPGLSVAVDAVAFDLDAGLMTVSGFKP